MCALNTCHLAGTLNYFDTLMVAWHVRFYYAQGTAALADLRSRLRLCFNAPKCSSPKATHCVPGTMLPHIGNAQKAAASF
jgi:hypothetical protein